MSLNVLALVAPSVTNEVLGAVAAELLKVMPAAELGAAIRPILPAPTAVNVTAANKSDTLPESDTARAALMESIYDSFDGNYRRRSVGALSRATGLTAASVLELIANNQDFSVREGSSGRQFVSLRGAR